MHSTRIDESLNGTLEWAMERLRRKGYEVTSKVSLSVDEGLNIMGYAKQVGEVHKIIISAWALDSEMLGGLVLHELAHVYFTERGASSHDGAVLDEVLNELKERDGLRAKESEYLVDAFNHLQNILVDDVVFAVMEDKELGTATRFFSEWVSDRPSGDPMLDASLLSRNAFAVASLRRRGLFEEDGDLYYRNKGFLGCMGEQCEQEFEWLERFLERSSQEWTREEFRGVLKEYFDRMLSLMRSSSRMDDLR